MGIAYWYLIKFYLGTSKQIQNLEAASKTPLYTSFSNTLGGLETVRAFHAETYFRDQADVAINRSQGPFYYRFGGLVRTHHVLFLRRVSLKYSPSDCLEVPAYRAILVDHADCDWNRCHRSWSS